ncbi:beta-lactamase [Truncatella angustata]|uniref:Beta-lactamase n=1 Tax=Truncatella angustata TaxID=152316 RepID=A0A9P8UFI0_9PEZI|nr:beta-lactamase [Truncatella angustata]KAH6649035.1 beta-lactamase [Truncatella angustata]KAH8201785.1 hypothetical protein TruAng_004049 [Truncatella angustata]
MSLFNELDKLISSQKNPQVDPNEFFTSLGAPSVSIAVLDHGEISARCYSTIGDGTNTRFQACSISKPVTALAVMRLVDQGRLKLEDKIARFLPQIIVDNLGPAALVQEITIEHILSHTAGLTTSGFIGYSDADHPSPTEVVLGRHPVNSMPVQAVGVPGRQWSYSGGGYSLLQIALENLTSQPFTELMDELVLRPLEMNDSNYGTPGDGVKLAPSYWTGVTPSPHWHYFPELAAAGLWTTPSDLCKVLHAVQRSLRGSDSSFLKTGTTKRMLTEVESNLMGLGWVAPKDPGTFFGHTGSNDPGYRCIAMGIADLVGQKKDFLNGECGIVVMTNSSYGTLPAYTALQTINYLKGWRQGAIISQSTWFVTPMKLHNHETRGDWKDWQGRWVEKSDEWTIEADSDGQPQARWREKQPNRLLPAAICSKVFAEGESLDLVLDGVGAMMRLGWRDGERSIDYMDGLTYDVTKLSRAKSPVPS